MSPGASSKNQAALTAGEKDLIVAALRNFDSQRYALIGYVVMNDHVHVVLSPKTGHRLEAIIHSWKSYTANQMQRAFRRTGHIWQREYFDRVIRDDRELKDRVDYILGNPGKRWPKIEEYSWVWAAAEEP